ncbi:MAG TPA: hypothetical protein VHY37_01495 [Tepidisphaeraceae bacterium]|nr:hypothetical protein [Tepidisphaeraceae bacterium]
MCFSAAAIRPGSTSGVSDVGYKFISHLDEAAHAQDDAFMSADGNESAAGSNGNNLPRILSVLDLLTEEELVQLNHVIVQRLRLMQQIRAHKQMVNLRVGQTVSFPDSRGQRIRGVLTRHNRKSVTVVTPEGQQWNVSPALVRPE